MSQADADQGPSKASRYFVGPLVIVASLVGTALALNGADLQVPLVGVIAAGLFGVLAGVGQTWPQQLAGVRRVGVGGLSLMAVALFVGPLIKFTNIGGLGYAFGIMFDRYGSGLVFVAVGVVLGVYFAVTGRSMIAYFYEN